MRDSEAVNTCREHFPGKRMQLSLAVGVFLAAAVLLLTPGSTSAAPNQGEWTVFVPEPSRIRTHLYELQLLAVRLEDFGGSGGAFAPLGDGLLLVTPKGRIAMIQANSEVRYLPETVPMGTTPEEPITWNGFRVADMLLHERQPGSYSLFVSHHYATGDCVEFRISSILLRLTQEGPTISGDWNTEFTANPCIKNVIFDVWRGDIIHVGGGVQAGGRMLMDGDEHLLAAVGDHGWFEWHERQETGEGERTPNVQPGSHLGKLIRLELATGEVEVVASGFRNPQGLARDAQGNLWQTEHGPLGGDELNLLKPGLDYGWPYVTHGIQYGRTVWPFSSSQGRHDGFEEPVYSWVPSIAISNIIFSDGQQFPLWKDDLLIASLRNHSLFRVRMRDERPVFIEKIEIGDRIRDIAQMPDGRIALLSDSSKVLFLQRAPLYCGDGNSTKSIYSYDVEDVCFDIGGIVNEADDPTVRSLEGANFDLPGLSSFFNVHIHEDWLIYVKTPCGEHDLSNRFFVHIVPINSEDLEEVTREFGVNVKDFSVYEDAVASAINERGCIVALKLPEYEIKRIYTGQVIPVESAEGEVSYVGPIWEGTLWLIDEEQETVAAQEVEQPAEEEQTGLAGDEIAGLLGEADDLIIRALSGAYLGEPFIRSLFEVYIYESWLVYISRDCSEEDLVHRFFLHITPTDTADLAEEQLGQGFNVYDFYASDARVGTAMIGDGCIVARALPGYEFGHLFTGQSIRVVSPTGEVSWEGPVWEGSNYPDETNPGATPAGAVALIAGTGGQNGLSGGELFAVNCGSCHMLTAEHSIGPHLDGLVGRRAGDVDGFSGSTALGALDIVWTRENLAEYIAEPSRFAPGTEMADMGITQEEAEAIADFLASQ